MASEMKFMTGQLKASFGNSDLTSSKHWMVVREDRPLVVALILTDGIPELEDTAKGNAHLYASSPRMFAALTKIATWFEDQAARCEKQAQDTRFITIAEASAADAKNYRAMARDARNALPAA